MKRNENPGAGTVLPPGKPYVDPRVPRGALTPAEVYQAGHEARKKNALIKSQTPVAGGEAPRIPRLDGQAREGMTMQQQAMAADQHLRRTMEAVKQAQEGGFVEPPSPAGPPKLNLTAGDILPDVARQDPDFIQGHGSMFAVNQPHLAAKYGIIRKGQTLAPQQLLSQPDGQPKLRPETLQDLETLKRLQEAQRTGGQPPVGEGQTSELGAAAGRVGNLPGDDSEKPLTEEEKKQAQAALDDMDEFQFDSLRQAVMKDMLNNREQKGIIEARLKPMDVGDLVLQGYLIQDVPIIPGKFEVAFRTTEGDTDLAIKRIIMEDAKSLEVSERYYLDKFSLMSMAALLYSINKKPLPDQYNEHGLFDDDKFRKKFQMVSRYPFHMLASIGVHAMWFEERVRSLFVMEKVGNG